MNKHIRFVILTAVIVTSCAVVYVVSDSKEGAMSSVPAVEELAVTASPNSVSSVAESRPIAAQEASQNTPNTEEISTSKLAYYRGFGHAVEEDEKIFTEEEMARERLISSCMKNYGFTYTPSPSVVIDESSATSPEELDRLLLEAATDPNEHYVRSLSPAKRSSYYISLTGMANPNDPEGLAHNLDLQRDSCVGQAFQKIPGVYAKRNLLNKAYDELEQQILTDPRISAGLNEWSECMSEEGFAYSRPEDVHREADQMMADFFERHTTANAGKFHNAQIDKALKILVHCDAKTELSQKRKAVRIEYENGFVEENIAQLNQP